MKHMTKAKVLKQSKHETIWAQTLLVNWKNRTSGSHWHKGNSMMCVPRSQSIILRDF